MHTLRRTVRGYQVLVKGPLRQWFRIVRLVLNLIDSLFAHPAQDGGGLPSAPDGAPAPVVQDCGLCFELESLLVQPAQDGEGLTTAPDGAPAPVVQDCASFAA